MKVIVTGGAGFIGSNFIYYMQKKYPTYQFICIDKLTYAGNISTIQAALDNSKMKFIKADICDEIAMKQIFSTEKPQIVVNFAAESHVDNSIKNPKIFMESNSLGTSILLETSRMFGVERFHQISTDEVYGDIPIDCDDIQFTENTTVKANSPYSSSKASADLLTMAYFRTYGLPVTISRCSNNYGPFQYPEKLIPKVIINALLNKPLPIYGTGLNMRNWLYVEDHCAAVDLIIHHGKPGEIYNVSGSKEMSNIDLVKNILKVLDKSESLITYVPDRSGHDRRYSVNSEKIQKTLGWKPKTNFEIGLEKTITWYQENVKWWEPLLKNIK